MNETLVFLVSGVIAALISAMVCLLFRLWDSQRAKCNAVQRPTADTLARGGSRGKRKHGLASGSNGQKSG